MANGLTYDTGALIAAERDDRLMWALHRASLSRGLVPTIPVGVLAEASTRGLNVPGDLAVLGFGDTLNGQFANPALSTVSVNATEMGLQVAEALLRRFDGQKAEASVDTGFSIIERGSTARS